MKTISKEIKRNIGKELACVNVTLTLIIMGARAGHTFCDKRHGRRRMGGDMHARLGVADGHFYNIFCDCALPFVVFAVAYVLLAVSSLREKLRHRRRALRLRLCADVHMDTAEFQGDGIFRVGSCLLREPYIAFRTLSACEEGRQAAGALPSALCLLAGISSHIFVRTFGDKLKD